MKFLSLLILTLAFAQSSYGANFNSRCSISTKGIPASNPWETNFIIKNGQVKPASHQVGSVNLSLTIRLGGAAFADVAVLNIQSQKPVRNVELFGLLDSYGSGNIVFIDKADYLMIDCQFRSSQN